MANLSTFSTIEEKVKKYKDDYSLDKLSDAFEWLALEAILSLNEDEIEDAVTDGSMDGGIDAVHISGRDVHIFNFKYAESFDKSKDNFPGNEIDKILATMTSIYERTITEKEVNPLLWDKVIEIWDLFKLGPLNFKYYLCSNKEKPIVQAITKFESALVKFRHVDFFYYDQEDIVQKILEKKYPKISGTVRFVDMQYFDRSDGPLKGIVATIYATDLINLVKDPTNPDKINENAFNENVRVYLKLKNPINQSIYETALADQNYEFWYLNNGVTIVCEECIYTPHTPTPTVKLNNLQVVNGGQTTHALFEAYQKDKEKLKSILLLVRICETKKDYHISEKISETTNSQTPVRSRDLRANDRIQKKLEEQFKAIGYFYERKKNQHQSEAKTKRIDSELLGQIYLAYYLDMPSEAKNQKTIVFGEKYADIFEENEISAVKMLLPYKLYLPLEVMKKEIQKKKRNKQDISEKEAFISRAIFHLLNVIKIIAEKKALDLNEDKNINKAMKQAIGVVSKIVAKESKKRGELYTHDKFFKEIQTNKIIREFVHKQYD